MAPVLREPSCPLEGTGGSWGMKSTQEAYTEIPLGKEMERQETEVKMKKFEELLHAVTQASQLVPSSLSFMREAKKLVFVNVF